MRCCGIGESAGNRPIAKAGEGRKCLDDLITNIAVLIIVAVAIGYFILMTNRLSAGGGMIA